MNARKTYTEAWRNMRLARKVIPHKSIGVHAMRYANQTMTNCFHGDFSATEPEYKAYVSFMARKAEGSGMYFKRFLDCLESAQKGLAWADRNHWYFMLDYNEEHCFTNAEMGRFARYFKQSLYMTEHQYTKLMGYGAESISWLGWQDCEVYPVKPYGFAYTRFIIGRSGTNMSANWVLDHNKTALMAKLEHCSTGTPIKSLLGNTRIIPTQADYDEAEADLQAELSMQRYGG